MKRSEFKARKKERKLAYQYFLEKGYNHDDIIGYLNSDAFKFVVRTHIKEGQYDL